MGMPGRTRIIRRYRWAATTASARAAIWERSDSTSSLISWLVIENAPSIRTLIRLSSARSSAVRSVTSRSSAPGTQSIPIPSDPTSSGRGAPWSEDDTASGSSEPVDGSSQLNE